MQAIEVARAVGLGVVLSVNAGCSEVKAASAGDGTGGTGGHEGSPLVTRTYFEVATQVTAASLTGLLRLDGPSVETGVGSVLFLNSQLVEGGRFVGDAGLPRVVDGTVVGTMHGVCTNVGGGLSLAPEGTPGRVGKCEQALNMHGQGQLIVSGLIEQDRFEAGEKQILAVTGGTGAYQGAHGELGVTQLTFPGIVKKLELSFRTQ